MYLSHSVYSREVTEAFVCTRSWVHVVLCLEVLVDDAVIISTEHSLSVSDKSRVVILVQVVLRIVIRGTWSCNFLCWNLESVTSAEAKLTLGVVD